MTAETLGAVAGIALSLLMGYIPPFEPWYNSLEKKSKAGVMALLLLVVAVGVFALSCGAIVSVGITCDQQGAVELVKVFIAALVANQAGFEIGVRPFEKKL